MVAFDHIFWPVGRLSPRQFVYHSSLRVLILTVFFQDVCLGSKHFLPLSSPTNCLFPLLDVVPPSQYTNAPSPDSPTDDSQRIQHDGFPSKPQTSHRPTDQTNHYPQDIQRDQLQRGVVLGPPGSPQGAKSVSQAQKDDRLNTLEKRLDELARMLDMVKAQVATVFDLAYSIILIMKNVMM